MPEIAAPGLRAADGTRLAMPCQTYCRILGHTHTTTAALLAAVPRMLRCADDAHANGEAVLLECTVGCRDGDESHLTLESTGTAFHIGIDGRWVDGTPWASAEASVMALVATVLDIQNT